MMMNDKKKLIESVELELPISGGERRRRTTVVTLRQAFAGRAVGHTAFVSDAFCSLFRPLSGAVVRASETQDLNIS